MPYPGAGTVPRNRFYSFLNCPCYLHCKTITNSFIRGCVTSPHPHLTLSLSLHSLSPYYLLISLHLTERERALRNRRDNGPGHAQSTGSDGGGRAWTRYERRSRRDEAQVFQAPQMGQQRCASPLARLPSTRQRLLRWWGSMNLMDLVAAFFVFSIITASSYNESSSTFTSKDKSGR